MQFDIGDRVRFKAQLPDQTDPALQHHVGWEGEPGRSKPIIRTWSEHFGGEQGVVTSIDPTNRQVCVRGRHTDGTAFTVWIEERYLDVIEQGVPR